MRGCFCSSAPSEIGPAWPYSWPLIWRCFSQWAALVAFLIEMLLASRGLRDQANSADEVGEAHSESAPLLDPSGVGPALRSVSGPHAE